MAHKVSDTISAFYKAKSDESAARDAAAAADKALTDATASRAAADTAVAADLHKLGKPIEYTNNDGSLSVFVPDATDGGYSVLNLAGPDATVEDDAPAGGGNGSPTPAPGASSSPPPPAAETPAAPPAEEPPPSAAAFPGTG